MDLLNRRVIHKSPLLGKGTIVQVKNGESGQIHLLIQFSARRLELQYPQAFETFIRAEDDAIQQIALAELAQMKREESERRERERLLREEKRMEAEKSAAQKKLPKASYSMRPGEKRLVFYVFHDASRNEIMETEMREGYIWVPSADVNGNSSYYWDLIREIRKDDLILHGYKGLVYAYSYADGTCFDCAEPDVKLKNDRERRPGLRLNCRYERIPDPIATSSYVEQIQRYSRQYYSAFDKDGNGQGVIAVLEDEIANLFIEETLKKNPELGLTR